MTSEDIRKLFFDYFVKKGHTIVPSSSLVPAEDPTLLFTNAGMVQFKKVFTGEERRSYTRAVSIQKCLRAGGKHNDLENVGFTARHHTFFEMLGNFSFGDYFKKEAIEMGWEFLTEVLHLPADRLWVSIYKDDSEAYKLWKAIGMPEDRIVPLGKEDNFWQMGDTGPCGPCSEIILDQGPEVGCGRSECRVGCDCDRYLELWNLVFMEFDRKDTGELQPLPGPCIDTGMGLERITAAVQGVKSNYDTDIFIPLIMAISRECGVPYKENGKEGKEEVALKVIVDHLRAIAFLISDGVMPTNEGRGYVLRRIIRRGSRYGRLIGLAEPFLYKYVHHVIEKMKIHYPELETSREIISTITRREEEGFINTLEHGMKVLDDIISKVGESGMQYIPGEELFRLYDTYGFPLDLTGEIAREHNLLLDEKGFHEAMERQRERARKAGLGEKEIKPIYRELKSSITTKFVGYDLTEATGQVVAIIKDGESISQASKDEEIEVIFDVTPFYGESGGQVGDKGVGLGPEGSIEIVDTKKPMDIIVHRVVVTGGHIRTGEEWVLRVNRNLRMATARSHTATHMLHAALRLVAGGHVKQAGSLVAPDRLRFDFVHFKPLSTDELRMVEDIINEKIMENLPVITEIMETSRAIDSGAIAFFDEKYGEMARVVQIPGFSKELCGGTHCMATGDIGIIKIISESSIAAGIRRIEALTGKASIEYLEKAEKTLFEMREILKVVPEEVKDKTIKLLSTMKEQEKEIERLKRELNVYRAKDILSEIVEVDGIKVISKRVEVENIRELRDFADSIKSKIRSGIITLGSEIDGKVAITVTVTRDLLNMVDACKIVENIAPEVEGHGGGRSDMAQAGGKKVEGLDRAIKRVVEVVKDMVKESNP